LLKFNNIAFRIRASILSGIFLCLIAVAIYYPNRQEELYLQNAERRLTEMAKTISLGIDLAIEHQSFYGIQESIELVTEIDDFEFLAIIEKDSTNSNYIFAKNPSDYPDERIFERDSTNNTYFEYPFSMDPDFEGVIIIASSKLKAAQDIAELNRPIYIFLGFLLLIGIVVSSYLSNAITRPLHKLTDIAKQLTFGNYDLKIPIAQSDDELSLLNNNFALLCDTLRLSKQTNDNFNTYLESEIHRRTKDLEAANETLNQAQIVANLAHFELDSQMNVKSYSESTYDMLGLDSIETMHFGDLLNFVSRKDVSSLIDYLGGGFESESIFKRDILFKRNDISSEVVEKWISVTLKPVLIDEEHKGFRGILQDITERKFKEAEIYRLSLVAQNTSNAVIITDVNRKIVWVNQSAELITGYSKEEMFGNSPSMFQFEKTDATTKARIKDSLDKNIPIRAEILNRGKYGNEYWLELNIVPLHGDDYEMLGYIAIETDITERKSREDEIGKLLMLSQHQNERLKNFAHIISHNIRSHSSNFSMLLDMLLMESPELTTDENIEQLVQASKNLEKTIQHLNDVVAINTTILDALEPIKVFDLAERAILDVSALAKAANVDIQNHIDREATVLGLPAYVESILTNLITNGIKYRSNTRKPYVRLRSESKDSKLMISIEDNGLGIDLEIHGSKLFGMYKTFHKHEDARGIGLFITKNQVESMGGQIHVKSRVDDGTTFLVSLNHV
jgi:PAS domain S-box-containing protein